MVGTASRRLIDTDDTLIKVSKENNGYPVLLARAPGQVAEQPPPSGVSIIRGARSGNPAFDPRTGKFAGSGTKPEDLVPDIQIVQQTRSLPQGVTEEQWEHRQDLVRDAAREMDDMDAGDAKEFLRGHPNIKMAQVDIDLFLRDVRAQRLDDLVDILDQQLRGRIRGMARSRRHVKVSAPKGWTKRVFAGTSDEEVIKMVTRLEGRGWDPEDLVKNVISRVSDEERRTQLEQLYGESKPKRGRKQ